MQKVKIKKMHMYYIFYIVKCIKVEIKIKNRKTLKNININFNQNIVTLK